MLTFAVNYLWQSKIHKTTEKLFGVQYSRNRKEAK
jgi:hypothetical protein